MPSVADVISARFITSLEAGTVPWKRPWSTVRPYNFKTNTEYHGVNMLLLGMSEYSDPRWGTLKQITSAGGRVRRDEFSKYMPIIFAKEVPDRNDPEHNHFMFRYTRAYNVEQCDGLELATLEITHEDASDEAIEQFLELSGMWPFTTSSSASYNPVTDKIYIPSKSKFFTLSGYYSTAFHELTHSTGHPSRFNRFPSATGQVGEGYGREELVAEIGSAILCSHFHVETQDTFEQSSSYVQSWLSTIRRDSQMIITAASQAEKAVTLLLSGNMTGVVAVTGAAFECSSE